MRPEPNLGFMKIALFAMIPFLLLFALSEALSWQVLKLNGNLPKTQTWHPMFSEERSVNVFNQEANSRYMYDPYLLYRYRPNSRYGSLEINAQGFIANGSEFPDLLNKPKNAFRIFILGGSTVAGAGVENSTTIAALLEGILNKDGTRKFEVINAGVDGYMAFQELNSFTSNLHRYNPDMVVFYDGWNDLFYPTTEGGYTDAYQQGCCPVNNHAFLAFLQIAFARFIEQTPSAINNDVILNKTYTTILAKDVYTQFERKIRNRQFEAKDVSSNADLSKLSSMIRATPEEASRVYASVVENSVALMTGRGIKAIYALQPSLYDKKIRSPEETATLNDPKRLPKQDTVERFYQGTRQEFERLAKRYNSKNVTVTDLSLNIWDGVSETVYLDLCHTNSKGNSIIADRLSRIIRQQLNGSARIGYR